MTVVVGFVGPNGAVMASDSEATESRHTRYDVEKIWLNHGLLFGYTGNTSVRQRLEPAIETGLADRAADLPALDREQVRDVLLSLTLPALRQAYGFHVAGNLPIGGAPPGLAGALIISGRDTAGYWLLEIEENNIPTFYSERGFHTVGSGAAAAYTAHSLMEGYHSLGDSLAYLKLMAARTVQNCIDTMGGALGVGGKLRLWYSSATEVFVPADTDELKRIEEGVRQWRAIERESLREVVEGSGSGAAGYGVPLPEELGDDSAGASQAR